MCLKLRRFINSGSNGNCIPIINQISAIHPAQKTPQSFKRQQHWRIKGKQKKIKKKDILKDSPI